MASSMDVKLQTVDNDFLLLNFESEKGSQIFTLCKIVTATFEQ